jgi:hypothetical protein
VRRARSRKKSEDSRKTQWSIGKNEAEKLEEGGRRKICMDRRAATRAREGIQVSIGRASINRTFHTALGQWSCIHGSTNKISLIFIFTSLSPENFSTYRQVNLVEYNLVLRSSCAEVVQKPCRKSSPKPAVFLDSVNLVCQPH